MKVTVMLHRFTSRALLVSTLDGRAVQKQKLRQDLDACRKKLATAAAEIIKLRREAVTVDSRKKGRNVKNISENENKGEGEKGRSAGPIRVENRTRDMTPCVRACGEARVAQSWCVFNFFTSAKSCFRVHSVETLESEREGVETWGLSTTRN